MYCTHIQSLHSIYIYSFILLWKRSFKNKNIIFLIRQMWNATKMVLNILKDLSPTINYTLKKSYVKGSLSCSFCIVPIFEYWLFWKLWLFGLVPFDGPGSFIKLLSVQLKSDCSNASDCETKTVVLELEPADILEEHIWWSCLKSLGSNTELREGFSRFMLTSLELSVSPMLSLLAVIILGSMVDSEIPYKSAGDMEEVSILPRSSVLL